MCNVKTFRINAIRYIMSEYYSSNEDKFLFIELCPVVVLLRKSAFDLWRESQYATPLQRRPIEVLCNAVHPIKAAYKL
jgi:hypothetical protein